MLDMKNAKLFEKQLQSTCELLSEYKKLVGPEASEKIELILEKKQKNILTKREKYCKSVIFCDKLTWVFFKRVYNIPKDTKYR